MWIGPSIFLGGDEERLGDLFLLGGDKGERIRGGDENLLGDPLFLGGDDGDLRFGGEKDERLRMLACYQTWTPKKMQGGREEEWGHVTHSSSTSVASSLTMSDNTVL
jgi:hypothetical protein